MGYYWIIIPALIGIILFSMPWWYVKLFVAPFYDGVNESIKEHKSNTSLVDYTNPFNLKIRQISIWDITDVNEEESEDITLNNPGAHNYLTDNLTRFYFLLDSLKDRKTDITIELTLNTPKDTLNQQEQVRLRQGSFNLIELDSIQNVAYCRFYILKETDFTIQYSKEYTLSPTNERVVLLGQITVKKGKIMYPELHN